MTSRTPPLLEPYLSPLPSSAGAGALLLATSVLGASTNWLVLRLLHSLLLTKPSKPAAGSRSEGEDEGEGEVAVVLVSFLRDLSFWREAVARLGGGIDLAALGRRGRFGFIDGLSSAPGVGEAGGAAGTRWMRALAMSAAAGAEGDLYDNIRRAVLEVVELLKGTGEEKGRRVVLVVDGLDFVLASAPAPAAPSARDLLMDLREHTHAALVTLAADDPLIKEQETTLEKHHAWLALSLVHDADTVLSLRLLDTGAAKDVSGVIRITHGGANPDTKDHEYLYHVAGDGGVRVFERGQ